MPGMLYQIMNKERVLLKKAGRGHPDDANEQVKPTKPKLILREIPPRSNFVPNEVPVVNKKNIDVVSTQDEKSQTVGLHKVPISVVEALKAEAKRRSINGKKLNMTDISMMCFQIGLKELKKMPIE